MDPESRGPDRYTSLIVAMTMLATMQTKMMACIQIQNGDTAPS
jgi:hypothetical protein